MNFNKYIKIIDDIGKKYNYPNNIKHLLYVIVPAFILKYGIENENLILKCIDIPIRINNEENNFIEASYISIPYFDNEIKTKKLILLNNYNNSSYLQLIDDLIHELNHALNSINNEIILDNNDFYLRTGLTKIKYSNEFKIINKDKSFVLEEIINSKQTENIINIIKNIKSNEIENTVVAIRNSIEDKYISKAYLNIKYYCERLLNNKTFFLTLEKLRLKGKIDDIESWFDGIYGNGGYKLLIETLYDLYNLSKQKVLFKKNKIKKLVLKLIDISEVFNNNCNIKA